MRKEDIQDKALRTRIAHLSYYYGTKDTSGAPIAATRLHRALLEAGVDSHFICVRQLEPGPNVHAIPHSELGKRANYVATRALWVAMRVLFGKMYMPNWIPLPGFARLIRELRPDVLHAHFIYQDMLSFRQLLDAKTPLVITLHDLLAVNAFDPYPGNDRRFAEGWNKDNTPWMERLVFDRKRRFVETAKPVFTGPSEWVCRECRSSVIGRDRPVFFVPNIVDPRFAYDPARRVPHDRFTILFGAFGGRSSPLKGWPDLVAALELLPEAVKRNTVVNVFGESAEDGKAGGVDVHFLGKIANGPDLVAEHHKADVLAFPSRQETAGQVKVEALLDGLPVLAFDRTACADGVQSGENGWVAADGNIPAFAAGLRHYYDLFVSGRLEELRPRIAADAVNRFSNEAVLRQMRTAYSMATKSAVIESSDFPLDHRSEQSEHADD